MNADCQFDFLNLHHCIRSGYTIWELTGLINTICAVFGALVVSARHDSTTMVIIERDKVSIEKWRMLQNRLHTMMVTCLQPHTRDLWHHCSVVGISILTQKAMLCQGRSLFPRRVD